jgi:integrase
MKLTKAIVEGLTLPPGTSDKIYFDDELPGFGLRLRQGGKRDGKRSWIAQYRVGSKQRRVTVGTIKTTSLDAARTLARSVLAKVHLGSDPQAEKAERRARASITTGAMADRYLEHAVKRLKPRSYLEVERHLKKHWGVLARIPIGDVTRADVAAGLNRIATTSGPIASNRARATLSAFYTWAIGEGLADATPVLGTNRAAAEISRDRVLTDSELAAVWSEAGAGDYGAIVRLLILTGQRREEVGGMLWSEIDTAGAPGGAVWRIGAERTKNSLAHDVPLSAAALAVLEGLERREGRDLIFGTGNGPYQGWSNAKAALDVRVLAALGRPAAPWRLHDIRRTVATRLADLGVLPHVVEAVLNHVSGHKAGVAGVYNRASYAAEKRAALDLWAQRVERLTVD